MERSSHESRIKKYKKRRSVKRSIIILSVIGIILLISVLTMTIVTSESTKSDVKSPKDHNTNENKTLAKEDSKGESEDLQSNDAPSTRNDEATARETETFSQDAKDNFLVETKEVASDDPNVIIAKEGDWQPVGTQQEEPHVVNFERDSIDWQEMVTAIESVVNMDDMIIHWLGNGGEQKAIGTVSNHEKTEIYRVYISWVANKGWQPTRVEQLERVEVIK